MARSPGTKDGLGYNLINFENGENKNIHRVTADAIGISYDLEEKSWIKVPVPKDGETIYTDIKVPVIEGIVYELSAVRREGDALYIEDNRSINFLLGSDERQEAARNNEIGAVPLFTAGFEADTGKIINFNPDDLKIHSFDLTFYGDFAVTFD
jgi:hypothetical protein